MLNILIVAYYIGGIIGGNHCPDTHVLSRHPDSPHRYLLHHVITMLHVFLRLFGALPVQYEDFGISMCLLVAGPFLAMAAIIARKLQDPVVIEL